MKKSKNGSGGSERKIDSDVRRVFENFSSSYALWPKKEIARWKAYLIIMFVAGFAGALIWSASVSRYPKSTAAGTTYYVDASSGNDANAGTSETSAWKTIAKVSYRSFSPGDRILLKRGQVWREQLNISSSGASGTPITYGAYGTGDKPIINGADLVSSWTAENTGSYNIYYAAWSSDPKQVFQDGTRLKKVSSKAELSTPGTWFWDSSTSRTYVRCTDSGLPGSHKMELRKRDYCINFGNVSYLVFDGVSLVNAIQGLNSINSSNNIVFQNSYAGNNLEHGLKTWASRDPLYRADNWEIRDSEFAFNGASGVVGNANHRNWVIERNSVNKNCLLYDANNPSYYYCGGIVFYSDASSNIIQNNHVYENGAGQGDSGVGIWLDTVNGPGNIIRYNKVHDNTEHGIMLESTSDAQIYYNLSYNNSPGDYGRGILVAVNKYASRNNKIYNNVSYGNYYGIAVHGDWEAPVADTVTGNAVKNNISFGNAGPELATWWGGENDGINGSGNVYEYNNFGPEGTGFIMWGRSVSKSTYSSWETAYGNNTFSVKTDPMFSGASSGDFHLKSDSPNIDKGTSLGLSKDYSGVSVPQGAAPDIGAYETSGVTPPPPPPSDTTPPTRSDGSPTGTLSAGTVQTTLSLSTNENATCKYSTSSGVSYSSMANQFSTTGALNHSTSISGLSDEKSYAYYVRCKDLAGNENSDDYAIKFSISSPVPPPPPPPPPPPGDTSPPVVSISSPSNNSVFTKNMKISGSASDNVGVVSMKAILDENQVCTSISSTIACNIVTKKYSKGSHTIRVEATDAAGNKGSSTSSVVFQ